MVAFPNCKINLGLHIVAKRSDGYHNLETIFYPVAIQDVLEIMPDHGQNEGVDFTGTGLPIPGEINNNLCIKAWQLLKQDFPTLPAVKMHLHKTIPMGAGLGGGSADGAFALKLLNQKFQLGLSESQLIAYALQLGSDCPFFIINQPCFASGRGEVLEPISVILDDYRILIINPGIHVNTGWAFSHISPQPAAAALKDIIAQPLHTWKDNLTNDFEKPVFAAHPEVKAIKEKLYAEGAVYAAMTGSGSTVFGLFAKDHNFQALQQYYSGYLNRLV